MNDFAATHRRWGYKRAWARAKSEGIVIGRDTFRRLWRAEGLRVRARKAHKPRTAPRLQRLVKASAPGQVWAIDFQFDSDWKGRVFKVCNVIDEFTRQHLALRVERRMGGACQFFCVWGLEVGGDSVGVGGGELGEGLFPVGGGVSFDEAGVSCSFVGGFASVCEALGGSFVFDVADGEP